MALGWIVLAMLWTLFGPSQAFAASDLRLAPSLSFDDDSSPNFPITSADPQNAAIAADRPTLIFFGTAHCWNTAREAERLVTLYPKYRDRMHFVVVDLKHASPAQEALVHRYYQGYIPTLAIFDSQGKTVYDQAGETAGGRGDTRGLDALIRSALEAPRAAR
jgi:hypothetical protein